jgi:hypothetical protein
MCLAGEWGGGRAPGLQLVTHRRQPWGLGLVSVAMPTMRSACAGEMAAALPVSPRPCLMLAWVTAQDHSCAV